MLILSRRIGETLIIEENIEVTELYMRGYQVRVGIEALADVGIVREELVWREDERFEHQMS